MFETIAFLSTVTFIVIFVVLLQIDRSSRKDDSRGGRRHWLIQDLAQDRWTVDLPERIDAVIHLAQSPNYRDFAGAAPDAMCAPWPPQPCTSPTERSSASPGPMSASSCKDW